MNIRFGKRKKKGRNGVEWEFGGGVGCRRRWGVVVRVKRVHSAVKCSFHEGWEKRGEHFFGPAENLQSVISESR